MSQRAGGPPTSHLAAGDSQSSLWRPYPRGLLLSMIVFVLLSMVGGLAIHDGTRQSFARAVEVNRTWARLLADAAALSEAAIEVNAPAREVFESRDAEGEAARLAEARRTWDAQIEALRAKLAGLDPSVERSELLGAVEALHALVVHMAGHVEDTLHAYSAGEFDQAAVLETHADRDLAEAHRLLERLRPAIAAIQDANFAAQAATAEGLARLEYALAALLVLAIVAASLYARQVARAREQVLRLARLAELKTRAILHTAADGIVTCDPWGSIELANPAAARMFGWPLEELVGRDLRTLVPGLRLPLPDAAPADAGGLAADPSGVQHFELEGLRADGSRFPLELSVSGAWAGAAPLTVVVLRDISGRRQAEAELARARDAALAASRAKSQFLAAMSHEIRTPMNAILGMADLLAETPLSPEQREYVKTFQRAGDTLRVLLDDILDLSRVEAGQLTLEQVPFDLEALLDGVGELLAPGAHARGLELVLRLAPGTPTRLVGDPTRLRQVITNLLGNAIKFTEAGEIGLVVEPAPEHGVPGWLRFTVWDTGIGIPEDKQAHIFEAFTQADASTTRLYGGAGLGLTICRRLVELMGGRIWVESAPGRGSRFTFTARFGLHEGAVPSSPAPAADVRGWRVLVVDDNPTNRLLLREALLPLGAEVSLAASGGEGLRMARQAMEAGQPFRLVLLDGRMPDLSGFEVAERLKRDGRGAERTILMLTSDASQEDLARVRALGLGGYLLKPLKRSDLLVAIARLAAEQAPAAERSAVEAAASAPLAPADERRPARLLLVEDTRDNQLLVKAFLKRLPLEVDVAENGREAVELFRGRSYDLVLMDMLMPEMDGLEATRAIRAWEQAQGRAPTPIIALTASAMASDVEAALAAGCTAHLAKPVKRATLLEAITTYLGGTSA